MTLIKTSLLNGIAVIIKMVTLLGLNKVLAIYIGPTGYAALGQFQNAMQMITTLASGAINTGVTKYTAEYHQDEAKQHAVWRTAGTISLVGSLIIAIVLIAFNRHLAGWFLKDDELGSVFIWVAATLTFFVFNTLLLSILNGKKEIRRYVTANIAGSLFSLIVTSILAIKLGLYGALVALAVYQSLTFVVTWVLTYKASWFKFRHLLGRIDKQVARNLGKFTLMAITSAVCVPLSHILIRNHLGVTFGWEVAGYWEAMWRLSTAYLMVITTTLAVYYLPKLSALQDMAEIKREILQGYSVILPVAAVLGFSIYMFREFIVLALFTDDFSGMEALFGWQVIGDTLKVGSWILTYLVLSKAMMKLFVLTEIGFALFFYFLTCAFTSEFGLEGVAIAHAANYLIYWVVVGAFIIWRPAIVGFR